MDVKEAPDFITAAQAAEILGVDRSGIIRRVKAGTLQPVQTLPGKTGSHLFSRADVLALTSSSPEDAVPAGYRGEAGTPTGMAPAVALPDPGDGGGSSTSAA